MITAKVIEDSIANNSRLTTMELTYPRFIHAEAKTHRIISLDDEEYELILKQDVDLMDDPMLSRNASSSRAIPVEKQIHQVLNTPATPIHWGKNQPGMQAREEIDFPALAQDIWKYASELAVDRAYELKDLDIHKQIVNRLLEPFQYIKVIVTATEYDNFFKLRCHEDAQPEIAQLALRMKEAMDSSTPDTLELGEWHLPYITEPSGKIEDDIKCSVARCARVSYLNHDNSSPDIEKDLQLAAKLLKAGHLSPLEHQLSPMESPKDNYNFEKGVTHIDRYGWKWSGNVRGWYQYRQLI